MVLFLTQGSKVFILMHLVRRKKIKDFQQGNEDKILAPLQFINETMSNLWFNSGFRSFGLR